MFINESDFCSLIFLTVPHSKGPIVNRFTGGYEWSFMGASIKVSSTLRDLVLSSVSHKQIFSSRNNYFPINNDKRDWYDFKFYIDRICCWVNAQSEKTFVQWAALQLASKEKEKKMSQQSQNSNIVSSKWRVKNVCQFLIFVILNRVGLNI